MKEKITAGRLTEGTENMQYVIIFSYRCFLISLDCELYAVLILKLFGSLAH